MKRTPEDIARWRGIWLAARRNMPKSHLRNTGWSMLGRLMYGGSGFNMRVYNKTYTGVMPKDADERDRLLAFSGPYGKVFARAALRKQGLDPNKYIWK